MSPTWELLFCHLCSQRAWWRELLLSEALGPNDSDYWRRLGLFAKLFKRNIWIMINSLILRHLKLARWRRHSTAAKHTVKRVCCRDYWTRHWVPLQTAAFNSLNNRQLCWCVIYRLLSPRFKRRSARCESSLHAAKASGFPLGKGTITWEQYWSVPWRRMVHSTSSWKCTANGNNSPAKHKLWFYYCPGLWHQQDSQSTRHALGAFGICIAVGKIFAMDI